MLSSSALAAEIVELDELSGCVEHCMPCGIHVTLGTASKYLRRAADRNAEGRSREATNLLASVRNDLDSLAFLRR